MALNPCLGPGVYDARIVRRRSLLGPPVPKGELSPLSGSWSRRLSSTSDAEITVGIAGPDAGAVCSIVAAIDPGRDEMELYRDGDLCHVSAIENVIDKRDGTAQILGNDLSWWFGGRVFTETQTPRQLDLATIFEQYALWALQVDDPGIEIVTSLVGEVGDRTIDAADVAVVLDQLGELARTAVDWTVTNRTFWVGGVEIAGRTVRIRSALTDESFTDPPQTRRSVSGWATDAFVRGNNVVGRYGGPDPSDGILYQRVRDDSAIEDQASADRAARSMWERAHEPAVYLDGVGALAPSAPVDLAEFIPGVLVPVDLSGGAVPYVGELRLESVVARFDADGDTVTPTLQPVGETS